jgi:hypothetical protein
MQLLIDGEWLVAAHGRVEGHRDTTAGKRVVITLTKLGTYAARETLLTSGVLPA